MRMTVADAIGRVAAQRAADRAFVFPGGGSNLEVLAALEDHGVEPVLTRSESGAAMMAAAYSDLVGRPSLVLVGLGPGVANAVNGLAHARLDQSSVVIISDRFTEPESARTGHQVLDQMALLAPVSKWQSTLGETGAAEVVQTAFSIAASAPRGPVHLELDRDLALATATAGRPFPEPAATTGDLQLGALAAGAATLTSARRPLVLVGDEAFAVSPRRLIALLECLGAPVLCSYKAKGAVPEEHALWCGIVTNSALEAALVDQADAILAIGLDPVELLARPWQAGAPVIALREHGEPSPGYRPRHVAIGEMSSLVGALHEALGDVASSWSLSAIAAVRDEMLSAVRISSHDSLSALEVVEEVQAQVPSGTTVSVDAGAHMLAATWGWRSSLPRRFLISNGLATMGFAVPAGIAASLARPHEPVIAFTGDGGFLLHGNELETAARVGARLVVVVLNDSSLSLIRIKQEERGHRRAGVDFGAVDAAEFGRALGATGFTAGTAAEVRAATTEALAQSGPAVIDVRISGSEYAELHRVIRTTGARTGSQSRASLCIR